MTNNTFHLSMFDNTVHIVALWYLLNYVHDQPNWFYLCCKILLVAYIGMACLIMLHQFFKSALNIGDKPKPPRHP